MSEELMPRIIKRPVLSEKSLRQATEDKYTFEVDLKANKYQIAQAVKKSFGVDVLSVRTRILKGKRVRIRGTRLERPGPIRKKATVEITKGQKISAFETAS